MVRSVRLCPSYSAMRPAFFFSAVISPFGGNGTTTPTRIVQIFSTLRLRLTVAGLKMTDTLVGLLY